MPSSSSQADFKMLKQEAKTTRMSIKRKNKLKKRRSLSSSSSHSSRVVQLLQQSERRSSSSTSGVMKRVKTLKRLVPNGIKCVGVDGLFMETAEYILALQLKVRVMQTMIDLVSNSGGD